MENVLNRRIMDGVDVGTMPPTSKQENVFQHKIAMRLLYKD
jgi:hypothetical protein